MKFHLLVSMINASKMKYVFRLMRATKLHPAQCYSYTTESSSIHK